MTTLSTARLHTSISLAVVLALTASLYWAQTSLGQGFLPHGYCLTWIPSLVWLHVVSDALIALAYLTIPVLLFVVARRRQDLPFSWLLLLFASFIVACGVTHAIGVWTLWHADYWISGAAKAVTAGVSVATAAMLFVLKPRLLAIPSTAQLQEAKRHLEAEVQARRDAETRLRAAQLELEQRVTQRTEALAQTTALLDSVWNAAPVGLAIFDANNRYRRVNHALARLNGSTAAAHDGRSLQDMIPALAETVGGQLDQVRGWGQAMVGVEMVGSTPANADPATFRVTYFPVLGAAEPGLVGAVCEDISEQRFAEVQRERALEEAQAANRTKDEFMARVSHELRTPLQVMTTWVALLRSGLADAQTTAHALERLDHSVRLQARMINDLLDMARILNGRVHLELAAIDPQPVVANTVEALAGEAKERGVDLQLHTQAGQGLGLVMADAHRLEQVVNNLVSNAIKYTPADGSVRVDSQWTPQSWLLQVSDTGIGIAAAELDHVFQPFQRGSTAAQANRQGLGLGLAIAHNIVAQLGGQITVASEGLGRGSVFTLKLPRGQGEAAATAEAPGWDATALRGLQLLVVEDEPDVADGLRRSLQAHGASVACAATVQAAVQAAAQHPPDLLVCDLRLADGESGFDVLRRLRATHPALPAIACSAYGSHAMLRETQAAGFNRHLVKPVDHRSLLRAILALRQGS